MDKEYEVLGYIELYEWKERIVVDCILDELSNDFHKQILVCGLSDYLNWVKKFEYNFSNSTLYEFIFCDFVDSK